MKASAEVRSFGWASVFAAGWSSSRWRSESSTRSYSFSESCEAFRAMKSTTERTAGWVE